MANERELNERKALAERDPEFRECFDAHQALDRELNELLDRLHLTPSEELRVKELKKRKLLMKDRMETIKWRLKKERKI